MEPSQLDGYYTVQQIMNLPGDHKSSQLLNIIGFVHDYQPPMKTQGTSWKCTIDIVDHSIRDRDTGLKIVIFWPESSMPSTPGFADVIIVSKAKIQMHGGHPSLLASKATSIHILSINEIPKKTSDAAMMKNLWKSCSYDHGPNTKKITAPSVSESKLAISMSNKRNEIFILATGSEIQSRIGLTKNKREKFGLIKDVQPDSFYNIIGEVRKYWPSSDSWVTVYLSDYTANSRLYDYTRAEDPPNLLDQEGDELGYIGAIKRKSSIPGPYGKLIIQITLWDGDADFIRDEVQCGHWLYIKNVRMKLGKNNLIEGAVHGQDNETHVQKLKLEKHFPYEINKRWKVALQRKQAWWTSFEQELIEERKKQSVESLRSKRTFDGDNEVSAQKNKNGKQRRKELRVQREKKSARIDAKTAARLELNENIQASYPDQKIVPLRIVLLPCQLSHPRPEVIYAPFTNFKYRVNVRVVDYFPHEIENFAVPFSEIESDFLSDVSEPEDNDTIVDNKWEWRFSLLLEDASIPNSLQNQRLWVLVDNHTAQGLLSIEEDAENLRVNRDLLVKVKEQLFKLWGDLEEQKSAILQKYRSSKNESPPSSADSGTPLSSLNTNIGTQPDPDSDNDLEKSMHQFNKNLPRTSVTKLQAPGTINIGDQDMTTLDFTKLTSNLAPSNKAFTCCIRQYGVKVPEDDPLKANAGPRKRWQRLYGIFGTKIL